MPKTAAAEDLRKGSKVVAAIDLRDVPAGTAGRIMLVDGFSWIRYWVRFDNGVQLGTIPRAKLATPGQWKRHLAGDDVLGAAAVTVGPDAAAGADAEAADGGGKTTPSGTFVPEKLLDRSAAARARLAA